MVAALYRQNTKREIIERQTLVLISPASFRLVTSPAVVAPYSRDIEPNQQFVGNVTSASDQVETRLVRFLKVVSTRPPFGFTFFKELPDVVMCNGNYGYLFALRFFYSRRARFRVTQR